jgi:hypothetical protein
MYHSPGGGCCDCGDLAAWSAVGEARRCCWWGQALLQCCCVWHEPMAGGKSSTLDLVIWQLAARKAGCRRNGGRLLRLCWPGKSSHAALLSMSATCRACMEPHMVTWQSTVVGHSLPESSLLVRAPQVAARGMLPLLAGPWRSCCQALPAKVWPPCCAWHWRRMSPAWKVRAGMAQAPCSLYVCLQGLSLGSPLPALHC